MHVGGIASSHVIWCMYVNEHVLKYVDDNEDDDVYLQCLIHHTMIL